MAAEYTKKCLIIGIAAVFAAVNLTSCGVSRESAAKESENNSKTAEKMSGQTNKSGNTGETNHGTEFASKETEEEDEPAKPAAVIYPEGENLRERFSCPDGFHRTDADKDSLTEYLRKYPLKKDGSPVLLYDGSPKRNQSVHAAVFKLPIEGEDLQQCADSIMRVYGEYYYSLRQFTKIRFPMGGGFVADFGKWSKGYGIGVDGDRLYWKSNSENNTGYASFQKFMRIVFAYSGTLNMDEHAEKIPLSDIDVGDIFIKGGSPGHVVMVVDVCADENGRKGFLLGQGYMPAQEFHVLKNPLHPADPWYYQDEIAYPLDTGEYTFPQNSLKRLKRS